MSSSARNRNKATGLPKRSGRAFSKSPCSSPQQVHNRPAFGEVASRSAHSQPAGRTHRSTFRSSPPPPAHGEEADGGDAHDEQGEVRQLLRGAIEQIRGQVHPQTWQAFWKVVVEGKTPEEIGEELAKRPGTVRVAKARVLSRLRSELGELF